MFAGDHDIERALDELARGLPVPLLALARIAYDYAPATFISVST